MMPAISPTTGSISGATRQICRSRMNPAISMALKYGLALLDERLGRFLMVCGLARARVMHRFGIEAGFQRHVFGVVDVLLDVTERDRGPLRQRHRQLMRRCLDLDVG